MIRYIARRVLYMVPTVFGVILITFILFNIAGGDPALLRLGKQATPRTLEDYNVTRGLNKPLLFGPWGRTRAYDTDLRSGPGPWGKVKGVDFTNEPARIRLTPGGPYPIPVAFNLAPSTRYRWTMVWRRLPDAPRSGVQGTGGGRANEPGREPPGTTRDVDPAALAVADGSNEVHSVPLTGGEAWTRTGLDFQTGADTGDLRTLLAVKEGTLEIRSLRLQRRMRSVFDSQLVFFLGQIVRLDFGESQESNQRVSRMILDGILPSLALAVPIFFIGVLVEISLALVCAFFRNSFIDRFFVIISVMMMSVPYLVWIILGQYVLGYLFRMFPVWGFESLRYIVLPCLIGVLSGLGGGLRLYRTVMLDEMYRDYVRTAFAKGVSRRGVLFKHVLKNAMIPVLTSVVMAIPFLYTGNLLLETFFGIPGLGNLSINALNNSDVDVIRVVVLIGAVIYVISNLLTDICYAMVDPRVRLR